MVYFEFRHHAANSDDALDRALNDAAFALAQIADVYYENEVGHVLRIPDEDLRDGHFGEGAKIFRTRAGRTFTMVSMRRIDLMYAMQVLHRASRAIGIATRDADLDATGTKPDVGS